MSGRSLGRFATLALVAALFIAGCGDDSSSSSSGGAAC